MYLPTDSLHHVLLQNQISHRRTCGTYRKKQYFHNGKHSISRRLVDMTTVKLIEAESRKLKRNDKNWKIFCKAINSFINRI